MMVIKNKYLTKILIILLIGLLITLINTVANAKYIIKNEFYIANLNIDRTKPKIELIGITNTNTHYENYANKTHTINVKVKITDQNFKNIFCDKEHIKIKIDNTYINSEDMEITRIKDLREEKNYQIQLRNIEGNGKLKIEFIEGTAIDLSELKNDKVEFDTNIIIDNTKPTGEFVENKIANGKINGVINVSEQIRNVEGWDFSGDKQHLSKEFTNNISYKLPIKDYAGNENFVEVNITQATYINLIYASHNSNVGWTYGYGNYDVAGGSAISINPILKTEAIAFNVNGNVETDFVQANAYVYTYWGEGSFARCRTSGMLYNYGYNPNDGTYKSMNSDDWVIINSRKYFQFGGSGINATGNTDIYGNRPIPNDIANSHSYGISGMSLKLKDYSQFAIVYQILVDKVGWINACSNGQQCMYSKERPMSGFRVALVPKSEKQYVLDSWNKDVGTFKVK